MFHCPYRGPVRDGGEIYRACCWESFQKSQYNCKLTCGCNEGVKIFRYLPVRIDRTIKSLEHTQVRQDRLWCVKSCCTLSARRWARSPRQAGFTPLCPCVSSCCSDRSVVAFTLGAELNETPAGQLCWHGLWSLLPNHRGSLPLLLPELCSVLTVSLFTVLPQWQNTRQGF